MSLGKNIRSHRERLGLTLEQLAERAGVEVGTISALELRDSSRSKYAAAIARGLGVPLEQLLDDNAAAGAAPVATAGKTLLLLRMVRGLSHEELAKAARVPQSAVLAIEAGTQADNAILDAVASVFSLSGQELATEAVNGLDGARALLERAARRAYAPDAPVLLADEHGAHEPQPVYIGPAPATAKTLAVVGIAQLGENGFYEQQQYPVGHGDGYIAHATRDPEAYCLQVRGDSMKPAIRNGWYVVVEPNGVPEPGEYVVVQLADGRKMVKELLFRHARSGDVEVMSVNGEARISIPGTSVVNIQPVAAVIPPSKVINP